MSDTWYKVDNVANVFLSAYTRRDPRVFRISCTLNEEIDPERLQQAAEKTSVEVPGFQVILHRGIFWHYMEETDIRPVVREETQQPCLPLYGPASRGRLHYRITYFHDRINLEVFHALSDGNGGVVFMNVLVQNYLQLAHPGQLESVSVYSGVSADEMTQDSYRQFYKKKSEEGESIDPASCSAPPGGYQIQSLKLPYDQERFYELHLPASDLLKLSRASGTSLTSWLGARLMMAIRSDMPTARSKQPVTIGLPVNLRNYYPSNTIRNFFNTVFVSHVFTGEETPDSLASEFEAKLREAVKPDHIRARMDSYEKLEQHIPVKAVPLLIKEPMVRLFTHREDRNVTATLSNLGRLSVDPGIVPYVKSFSAYCSTSTLFLTVCSYGDDLVIGVSSGYRASGVLRTFVRDLTAENIRITVYASEPIL